MVQTPNYKPGVGRLVTDRYDFESHIDGAGFRHNATMIDIANPALVPGNATTVENSLEAIQTFIAAQAGVGEGFITVGDGYDTYHAADGGQNYDPTIPSLDLLLNPIFAQIVAYQTNATPISAAYERIKDGGVVVIKSGTYIVVNTINVPPGITLMGEGFGTKIINATSLTLNSTPTVNFLIAPINQRSVFQILTASRVGDAAAGNNDVLMFAREAKICNMVISDNFYEPTFLGDTAYLFPQNRTTLNPGYASSIPLISQQEGSSLVLDNVYLVGRASTASYLTNYQVTQGCTTFAHALIAGGSAPAGTRFKMRNCIADGFGSISQFFSTAGSNDYYEVNNCQIRVYGLSPSGIDGYMTAFFTGNNNIKITSNTIYCEGFSYYSLTPAPTTSQGLLTVSIESSAPPLQGRSKILVASNNINVDKTSTIANIAFITIIDSVSTIPTYATSLAYGNSLNSVDSFDVEVDKFVALAATATGLNVTNLIAPSATITNATITTATITTGNVTTGNITNANLTAANITTANLEGAVYNNVNVLNAVIVGFSGAGVTPIVVTINNSNIVSTGDIVYITGSVVNAAANGLWIATAINPTTFSLNNSPPGTSAISVAYGSCYVLNHQVQASEYVVVAPTAALAGASVTFPIFESIELDTSAYVNVTSGVGTLSLQSGSEPNAISSGQGPGLIGQVVTLSNMTDATLNGNFTITSYIPSISGSAASIDTFSLHHATLSGGSGFYPALLGQPITISGSTHSNGTWVITAYNSPTSVSWSQFPLFGEDPSNPNISYYIPGMVTFNTTASTEVDGGNYTISNNVNIMLPNAQQGRNIIIKDGGAASPTNIVTVNTSGGYQLIENVANQYNYSITVPFMSLSLIGTSVTDIITVGAWFII